MQRVVGIVGVSHAREAGGKGVVEQEPAHQALADAEDLLHHFDCLERADHAGHSTQDARFRAGRHGALGRRLGEQAAIGGTRRAGLILLEGAEGGQMAVEGANRGENERAAREIAGIVDEVARGEIIRAVGDEVELGDDIERILRHEPRRVEAQLHMGIQALDGLGGALGLEAADAARVVDDLALEIVACDAVVVDDADGADARRGEIEQERRAEPARAHDEHARRLQPLLAFAADLLQQQMALIALDLVLAEHGPISMPSRPAPLPRGCRDQPVEPKPRSPRAVPASSSTASTRRCSTRATTSWAIRSPRRMVNGSAPRLTSSTMSSPR